MRDVPLLKGRKGTIMANNHVEFGKMFGEFSPWFLIHIEHFT